MAEPSPDDVYQEVVLRVTLELASAAGARSNINEEARNLLVGVVVGGCAVAVNLLTQAPELRERDSLLARAPDRSWRGMYIRRTGLCSVSGDRRGTARRASDTITTRKGLRVGCG